MSDVYIAKTSFATSLDGSRVVVRKGVTRVRAGHSLLKAFPEHFETVDGGPVHLEVEQATAEPGRKRGQQPKRSEK